MKEEEEQVKVPSVLEGLSSEFAATMPWPACTRRLGQGTSGISAERQRPISWPREPLSALTRRQERGPDGP